MEVGIEPRLIFNPSLERSPFILIHFIIIVKGVSFGKGALPTPTPSVVGRVTQRSFLIQRVEEGLILSLLVLG
jgi:hypothetical protein